MKKKILVLFVILMNLPLDAFALSFQCTLDWTPIIPCSNALYYEKPSWTYHITPVKNQPGVFSVKRTEHYVDEYCGDVLFSAKRVVTTRRRMKLSQSARKYTFRELSIYKEKGQTLLQAEGPFFNHVYPVGTCTVRR